MFQALACCFPNFALLTIPCIDIGSFDKIPFRVFLGILSLGYFVCIILLYNMQISLRIIDSEDIQGYYTRILYNDL